MRESLAPFERKPMVVLIRDCKDVLVSYYAMEVELFGRTHAARDIAEFVLGPVYGVRKFVSYYNELAASRRRGGAATQVTSYRELWDDPVGTLERDGAFIGAGGLGRAALERIVERYSFANMRQMELRGERGDRAAARRSSRRGRGTRCGVRAEGRQRQLAGAADARRRRPEIDAYVEGASRSAVPGAEAAQSADAAAVSD